MLSAVLVRSSTVLVLLSIAYLSKNSLNLISYSYEFLQHTRREGIANDTLEDVERAFVHPNLVASVEGNDDIDVSDGIGN